MIFLLEISLYLLTITLLIIAIKLISNARQLKYLSNKILVLIFFIISFLTFRSVFIKILSAYIFENARYFESYNSVWTNAIPILFYVYVRSVLFNEKKLSTPENYIHLGVFMFFALLYSLPYLPDASQQTMSNNELFWVIYSKSNIPQGLRFLRVVFSFTYLWLTYRLLYKYFKIKSYSKQVNAVKKWVFTITHIKAGITILLILFSLFLRESNNELLISLARNFAVIVFIYASLYLKSHLNLMYNIPEFLNPSFQNKENRKKSLQLSRIFETITNSIEQDKLFLNPKFNLPYVCNHFSIKAHEVSLSITEKGFKNFSDFGNSFKINFSKNLIAKGYLKTHNIDALSQESGFGSTNSFYRAFKKSEGITPATFAKNS